VPSAWFGVLMKRRSERGDCAASACRQSSEWNTATRVRVPQSWSPSLGWRPGRVYFLTILEPLRDDRTPALTARSASHMPPYGAKNPRSTYLQLMPRLGRPATAASRSRACGIRPGTRSAQYRFVESAQPRVPLGSSTGRSETAPVARQVRAVLSTPSPRAYIFR
jgi:hypothetical protein